MSQHRHRTGLALTLAAAMALAACGNPAAHELEPPATKVPIDGTDRYRVILTPEAAVRLDIQTDEVLETDLGQAVPYDAMILEPDGRFWVYVTPQPLEFERAELVDVREEDGLLYFSEGPEVGTEVVVVGVPELWGEETGVGK